MCGIAGFFNKNVEYQQNHEAAATLFKMRDVLRHRGPDEDGMYLSGPFALAHTRLSIIDLTTGSQPLIREEGGITYGIVYNGEIYNMPEIRADLLARGYTLHTTSDTELILLGHMEYGLDFIEKLNGIFAYAFMDGKNQTLTLVRDRFGVKPLFFARLGDTLVFGSEPKAIFAHGGLTPKLTREGLCEVFGIGPAKTYGCGVFDGMDELLPGHFLTAGESIEIRPYWKLTSHPHEDSYEETVEKTAFLVEDAILRQMVSDVPICTFLSGGVDSSIVSAICAKELKKKGERLATFSFDFHKNDQYFQPNAFQPSQDRPFVDKMAEFLGSEHTYLECSYSKLADYLYASVDARDLPAMADIDASLLYFCSIVKNTHKVVLTGECADEIFGGYPWFHRPELMYADTFPWAKDLEPRKALLDVDFLHALDMDTYVQERYQATLAEVPRLAGESPLEARRREIGYLNLKWFMQTLLDRMDRSSMVSGLEARVPFADHRLAEYIFNVPWNMKTPNGMVKGLLRESCRGMMPDEILFRKKSPYPKIYDPHYEALLADRLLSVMAEPNAPILRFLDREKVSHFLKSPSDYGKPWYGQLMAGPQMLAYLLQLNYWMETYHIEIAF